MPIMFAKYETLFGQARTQRPGAAVEIAVSLRHQLMRCRAS